MADTQRYCPSCLDVATAGEACACGYDGASTRQGPDLHPGTRLDAPGDGPRFLIGRLLNRHNPFGRHAACVYAARDLATGERVAVKEYLPQCLGVRRAEGNRLDVAARLKAPFEAARQTFLDEARALQQNPHPGICPVSHVFEALGTAFMVMPYIDGVSLGDLVEARGPLSPAVATPLMTAVVEGLRQVHPMVAHRNLTPDDIIVRHDGGPVLTGFCSVRPRFDRDTVVMRSDESFRTSMSIGDAEAGPWGDVYGCAAILYYITTGIHPPSHRVRLGETEDSLMPPATLSPEIAPWLSRAILAGMSLNLRRRPADAGSFLKRLRPPTSPLARLRHLRTWLRSPWTAVAALAVIAAWLAWLTVQSVATTRELNRLRYGPTVASYESSDWGEASSAIPVTAPSDSGPGKETSSTTYVEGVPPPSQGKSPPLIMVDGKITHNKKNDKVWK